VNLRWKFIYLGRRPSPLPLLSPDVLADVDVVHLKLSNIEQLNANACLIICHGPQCWTAQCALIICHGPLLPRSNLSLLLPTVNHLQYFINLIFMFLLLGVHEKTPVTADSVWPYKTWPFLGSNDNISKQRINKKGRCFQNEKPISAISPNRRCTIIDEIKFKGGNNDIGIFMGSFVDIANKFEVSNRCKISLLARHEFWFSNTFGRNGAPYFSDNRYILIFNSYSPKARRLSRISINFAYQMSFRAFWLASWLVNLRHHLPPG
jgi:hypothetical protein